MLTPRLLIGGCLSSLLLSVSTADAFIPSLERRSVPVPLGRSRVVISSTKAPDLLPGIEVIQQHNAELLDKLEALGTSNYFRLYSVDILASCEYMPQELFECYTESCEIFPVDEEEVSVYHGDLFIFWLRAVKWTLLNPTFNFQYFHYLPTFAVGPRLYQRA